MTPTVMTNVKLDTKIVCQETFAPIVSNVSYETFDETIALLNNSDLGLIAGIFTNNLEDAMRAEDDMSWRQGLLLLTMFQLSELIICLYGGVKNSSHGRVGIKYAVNEITEMKFITIRTEL
ncbi:aldehyde dehydrogenase family protein [Rummeliibacillus sp. NPDC094406]|uniref:aldehyde dehydrogenase family protein n=1 Tax=Rummeliibacillus sp. NPDC094406 TaxID=3364511 RepID=UPI0038109854